MFDTIAAFQNFIILVTLIFAILIIAIVAFLFQIQKKNQKHLQDKLALQNQYEQTLLQTQIEIQTQTLQTISQEIHDNVGQVLSLAKLNLGTLEESGNISNQTKINDARQLVGKAINDLRDLSRSLYGNKIAELGLADAIDNELTILQNSGQFKTSFSKTGESVKLDPQKEMVVFRILQECLNNAIKHSGAKNIDVALEYAPGLFALSVTDDGIGFVPDLRPQTQTGMGLKSMQNRAALIGGKLSVNSAPGQGTSVLVSLQNN